MAYWNLFGIKDYPILYKVAKIVYAIPCSQAASERIWSIFDFIHSKRRNRLSAEKTIKLVSLYAHAELVKDERNLVNIMMGVDSDGVGTSDELGN